MIGIGGPSINVKATLYVLFYAAAGAADKLWKWVGGTWGRGLTCQRQRVPIG